MTAALVLVAYAVLICVIGPRLLTSVGWTDRAPRLGIIAWQAATTAVVAAVSLAGTALVLPAVHLTTNLRELFRACVVMLSARHATPAGPLMAVVGTVVALGVLSRSASCVIGALARAARERARHGQALTLAGRHFPDIGAVVLEGAEPALYCVPGRRRRIVVTTGALALLDGAQLAAALAHERAHLRQRHDLVIAFALGLARAFPNVAVFRVASTETSRLVELLADDAAARATDRLTLADALLTLANGDTPAAALGAAGAGADRLRRLIAPPRPLSRGRTLAAGFVAAGLLAAPVTSFAIISPLATLDHCPAAGAVGTRHSGSAQDV